MYIDFGFKDEEQMIKDMKDKVGEEVVIHYECENCGNTQITNTMELSADMIDSLESVGYIPISLPCTECGADTRFLTPDLMIGMEY
jgi:hypothetical protein